MNAEERRARNRAAVDRYQRANRDKYLADRRAARLRRELAEPVAPFPCVYCPKSFASSQQRGHHEARSHPGLVPPHRIERAVALRRANRKRPEVRELDRERRRGNPKVRARFEVWKAIRAGVLVRQPCMVCGATPAQGHHHNGYENALDVQWLCSRHHTDAHRRAA